MQTLNENGQPVDRIVAYKVPHLGADYSGYEYAYTDDTLNGIMTKSDHKLDQGTGAIHETLNQIRKSNLTSTQGYICYNDEAPESAKMKDDNELGHTKGVLAWDTETGVGFHMLHSWPKFFDEEAAEAPTPIYGQTFICQTLSIDTLRQLASQMRNHQEPQVFRSCVQGLSNDDPLTLLTKPYDEKIEPAFDVIDCETVGGKKFKYLAKNRQWNNNFWNRVSQELGCDMEDETWIRGAIAPILSLDGKYRIADIKFVNMGSMGIHVEFSEQHDHAKWGISSDATKPWVVIADINRMLSQEKRGGGGIAFLDANIWASFSKAARIDVPPGTTRDMVHAHLKKTHK